MWFTWKVSWTPGSFGDYMASLWLHLLSLCSNFLPDYILPCHRPKSHSLLTNGTKTYSQYTEGNSTSVNIIFHHFLSEVDPEFEVKKGPKIKGLDFFSLIGSSGNILNVPHSLWKSWGKIRNKGKNAGLEVTPKKTAQSLS